MRRLLIGTAIAALALLSAINLRLGGTPGPQAGPYAGASAELTIGAAYAQSGCEDRWCFPFFPASGVCTEKPGYYCTYVLDHSFDPPILVCDAGEPCQL